MRPNENKVKAVKDFIPKNIKQVRSFLGLSGYYRKFVKDYAKIASPLFKLTKKSEKVVWTELVCPEVFDKLKRASASSPVLAYPDFSKTFNVFTDSSSDAIGMTLSQYHEKRERTIAYDGRDLTLLRKITQQLKKKRWPASKRSNIFNHIYMAIILSYILTRV